MQHATAAATPPLFTRHCTGVKSNSKSLQLLQLEPNARALDEFIRFCFCFCFCLILVVVGRDLYAACRTSSGTLMPPLAALISHSSRHFNLT